MSTIERIYGCELISMDLLHQLEKFDAKTPEWGRVYLELLEHLAYTQMVVERYLAGTSAAVRPAEAKRLEELAPTFYRLKKTCAIQSPEGVTYARA